MSVRYPNYTGYEPCAQIGVEHYYLDEGRGGSYTNLPLLIELCTTRCFVYDQCLQWAVEHEQHGFWAGTSEVDRQRLRRHGNIPLQDPVTAAERRTA